MMESGKPQSHFGDFGRCDGERPKLLVRRTAYRRFSRWMDKQLAELVRRWAHLATPNSRRISRLTSPENKAR
jgi:hypothetical protein